MMLMPNEMIDDTFELFDLKIEVHHNKNRPLVCNHPVGLCFYVSGENLTIPGNKSFPLYCLAALLPLIPAKQRPTHPHDWMSTDMDVACPDPHCGGVFRITRTGLKKFHHHEVTVVKLGKT